ncbi:phosphate uptake regulator (PhoU family) [Methanocella arvoryzae MRE50]|uniref:Phosphate-specific transport system accessory protein PhoU n=1 Tax=Methanocella arvoryzae (strain DSM 22066 / NBRC 105507 / MRE50) TaxID=351160 RepID=Q05HF3_METAR|nr:phosphate uptake regulator (PhoU family) [Methanocella arvoryzae MRE50]
MQQLIDVKSIVADTLKIAGLVGQSIEDSVRSLADRDIDLAGKVIDRDAEIDRLKLDIDRECIDALAGKLEGRDLRVVLGTYRMIVDLEHIGDYSVSVSRVTLAVANKPVSGTSLEIMKMAEIAGRMLKKCIDLYSGKTSGNLRTVYENDLGIDRLYGSVFYNSLGEIVHEPERSTNIIYLIMAARALERIGDHITEIAERVEYIETGQLKERSVPMHVPYGERDKGWE